MIFYNQDFEVNHSGNEVSGEYILDSLYSNKDVNGWGMIGAVLAYIALFRIVHFGLFYMASEPYLVKSGKKDSALVRAAETDNDALVKLLESY